MPLSAATLDFINSIVTVGVDGEIIAFGSDAKYYTTVFNGVEFILTQDFWSDDMIFKTNAPCPMLGGATADGWFAWFDDSPRSKTPHHWESAGDWPKPFSDISTEDVVNQADWTSYSSAEMQQAIAETERILVARTAILNQE